MNKEPLKLCMLSGSFEYESESSLTIFRDYVEREHPVRADLIVYRSEDDHQSLSAIKETDVLLVFTRRLNVDGEELERFKATAARAGPSWECVRPATRSRTGSPSTGRCWEGTTRCTGNTAPEPASDSSPAPKAIPSLEGVAEFSSAGSLYRNTPIAPDASLLMSASTDEHDEPVTWTRTHAGGRVFYTSLGHQEDFKDPNFLRLLANAVLWCGGRI